MSWLRPWAGYSNQSSHTLGTFKMTVTASLWHDTWALHESPWDLLSHLSSLWAFCSNDNKLLWSLWHIPMLFLPIICAHAASPAWCSTHKCAHTYIHNHLSLSSWYLCRNQLLQEAFPGPPGQLGASSCVLLIPLLPTIPAFIMVILSVCLSLTLD